MTKYLLKLLVDPVTKEKLKLVNERFDNLGNISSGDLISETGLSYPIINGIPRFAGYKTLDKSVESFGEQWNRFNFDKFKAHWLSHTINNSFDNGLKDIQGQIIVDAGGGAGMQSYWLLESGAKHVIMMDLSNTVDNIVKDNFFGKNYQNFDIIQCSIDMPPIKSNSIEGIVMCHNVIQHTPCIEKTAKALFDLVSPSSKFVFNVYRENNDGVLRKVRWSFYLRLRSFLSQRSMKFRLVYSNLMGILWFVPILGKLLKISMMLIKGKSPQDKNETIKQRVIREFCSVVTNTYDWYGSHSYQHHMRDNDLEKLMFKLQPDENKIENKDKYFSRKPVYNGSSLRIIK